MKAPGNILYDGPSRVDSGPIAAIASTGRSDNRKTDDAVQVTMIRTDVDPISAARQGLDRSICDSCKHRHCNGGICYVVLLYGPQSVYRAYQRGSYSTDRTTNTLRTRFKDRMVRIGTYGDPASVPRRVWTPILSMPNPITAYTHRWRRISSASWGWAMASVDSWKEYQLAKRRNWRTFRVKHADDPIGPNERLCPAYTHATTCSNCRLCDGRRNGPDIAINAHGCKKTTWAPDTTN
jgi:hypothetical protein